MVEIGLSRDEDSVTSLAFAHSSGTSATIFAGINSSSAAQQSGKNEHLRSFRVGYPQRRKKITDEKADTAEETARTPVESRALGKASLFSANSDPEQQTYQRVLKLSRSKNAGTAKIGAIATGLAPAGEVIVFDATSDSPGSNSIIKRIRLGNGEEAGDVDIVEKEEGRYRVAYCTEYDIQLLDVSTESEKGIRDPHFIHSTPHPDVFSPTKKRPTFRSLRFLTPNLVILLQNQPNRTGTELLLLEVPDSATLGTIVLRKRLHKSIKSATALSTTLLPVYSPTHSAQHVIAVAGQDISLTILTLDPSTGLSFRTHTILYDVHPLQMTALTFSTSSIPSDPSDTQLQYLKLASTSMSSTVVVHTFPLVPDPVPSKSQKSPKRYVLQPLGSRLSDQTSFSVIVAILVVGLGIFLLQAWTEIRGATPEYIGVKNWLPPWVHDAIVLPYMFDDATHTVPVIASPLPEINQATDPIAPHSDHKDATGTEDLAPDPEPADGPVPDVQPVANDDDRISLRSLLAHRRSSADSAEAVPLLSLASKAIMVRDQGEGLATELHADAEAAKRHGTVWEELGEGQRERWRRRLRDAGEWVVEEGEGVLKGVFFGGVGGLVGGVVGGE